MANPATQILKVYTSKEQQNHRQHWCGSDALNRFQLIAGADQLLPFVITRDTRVNAITSVLVKDASDDTTLETVTAEYTFVTETVNGVDSMKATIPAPPISPNLDTHAGKDAYLEITDTVETWRTEVFRITADTDLLVTAGKEKCGYVKIAYSHTCMNGLVPKDYSQHIYLPVDIGTPQYESEIDLFEDGDDNEEGSFARSEKIRSIKLVIPEWVIDALMLLPGIAALKGTVTITDQWGRSYAATRVDVGQPNWLGTGCFAELEIQFRTGANITRLCCDDEAVQLDCLDWDIQAEAEIANPSAEYTGGYYTPSGGGPNVNFAVNEYAIVNTAGVFTVEKWNGASWDTYTGSNVRDNVYNKDDDEFLFKVTSPANTWSKKPVITSAVESPTGTFTIKGETFRGSSVQLKGYIEFTGVVVTCEFMNIGLLTDGETFFTTGIIFTFTGIMTDIDSVTACAFTARCALTPCSDPVLETEACVSAS